MPQTRMGSVSGADSVLAGSGRLHRKRILLAKPGLDGHDAGIKVIAIALREAGAEVIYLGLRNSPRDIARVAVDENVDAVGLSVLSGSHMELVEETLRELAALGGGDVPVFVGGTIPDADQEGLRQAGVRGVFTNQIPLREVVEAIAAVLTLRVGRGLIEAATPRDTT